jgi:chromate transporter
MAIKIVANAFRGIKLAVGLLIFNAGIGMLSKLQKKLFPLIIFFSSMLLMLGSELLGFKVSTVIMMMAAGVLGLIYNGLQKVKTTDDIS